MKRTFEFPIGSNRILSIVCEKGCVWGGWIGYKWGSKEWKKSNIPMFGYISERRLRGLYNFLKEIFENEDEIENENLQDSR